VAFKNFARQLDDEERYTLKGLDEVLSFRAFACEHADFRFFELVTEVVTEHQATQFEYRKPGGKTAEVRWVAPNSAVSGFSANWLFFSTHLYFLVWKANCGWARGGIGRREGLRIQKMALFRRFFRLLAKCVSPLILLYEMQF
jgi:hypothetical protein